MLINADTRVCVIDLMAYWTSHYLSAPVTHSAVYRFTRFNLSINANKM